jgi:GT2 family glycosyltransferase/lipopolysaccharide/colanic/teichoic acid biosynthesis glycosyltransferase
MTSIPTISVIIVSYNVKEYLEQALISIKRALEKFSHEIFVVDNSSVDGSVSLVKQKFPEMEVIGLEKNVGFGKANNIALSKVKGEYVVLINPDTIVQEDTFLKLLDFFKDYPNASVATCKIINPDGSFSVDCRHSIPTPLIAFWRVTGMSKLFPKSKIFAKYNLTYLDEDQIYTVPAISGSFMVIKKQVFDEVGYFDERFFMYCEDIDLCYRIGQKGFNIYYVPTTQIIHFKGESTKKDNLDYVVTFNKSLYQFFQKYYANSHILLFRWLITLGIILRGFFIYVKNYFIQHFSLLIDILILNFVILFSFIFRMQFKDGFFWYDYLDNYWTINVISTVVFLGLAFYLEVYPKHRFSIQAIIKTNVLTFTLLASITFFLKQFAFSRLVVIIAAVFSPLFMLGWRSIFRKYYRGEKSAWGRDILSKRTVVAGDVESAANLYNKITDTKNISYDLLGIITVAENSSKIERSTISVLGSLSKLVELIRIHKIQQVIFTTENLPYERILKTIAAVNNPNIEFKIAPSDMEVMIGKSVVEPLESLPLLDVEYAFGKPFNRAIKRFFDIMIAALVILLSFPLSIAVLLKRKNLKSFEVFGEKGNIISITQIEKMDFKKPINRWLLFLEVFKGKISLVGYPIQRYQQDETKNSLWYKPGLTGLVQINQKKIRIDKDIEKYHLFYLKNQSFFLDFEILVKAVFQKTLFVRE